MKTRWLVPLILILLAIVIQLVGVRLVDNDGTVGGFIAMLTWMVTALAILIWWLFFSKMRWLIRLLGVVILLVVGALCSALFRFEGFTGDFKPHFTSRLASSNEERAIEYFADDSKTDNPATDTATASVTTSAGDWPKFGGPQGDQKVTANISPTDWQTNPPQALWRHPVGAGWSSFALVGDALYTQEQRGEDECVVCYQAQTGKQLWVHKDKERFEETMGGPGPRATPTFHEGNLYALGATGVLNCLNPTSGELIWATNIVKDSGGDLIEWAAAGSPVIHQDLVLVNPGTTSAFLAAYDRHTGDKKWQGPEAQAGYATPLVAEFEGVAQIIMFQGLGVGGYSIETGAELWFFEWTNKTKITVAQPIVLPDKSLFVSTGYTGGSVLLDISRAQPNGNWQATSRWERPNKFKLKFNGATYSDGHVYGLDEGILSCFDLKEGKRTWKKGRFGYGQVLMLKGQPKRMLILSERGEVVIVEVSPETMTEVARFSAIDGKTWNHPVLSNGLLYIRNDREAACYDLR